jgi:hypothetical protein
MSEVSCAETRDRGHTSAFNGAPDGSQTYLIVEGEEGGGEFIDGYGVLVLPTTGRYLQIPYRSLLPQGVRHLIVAGRATGGDRIAHAATRNMSCCAVTGQGAGVAAAVSIRSDRPLEDVDISAVQAELIRQDVRIS